MVNVDTYNFTKKYCLSHKNMIKKWIKAYNTFGYDAFIIKISKQKYTFDFKLFVIKLYLNAYLDMFNSEVLSYSITKSLSSFGIIKPLNKAINIINDCKYQRIFNFDKGSASQMKEYSKILKYNKIRQSMLKKGNWLANSIMANFFSILIQL